MRNIQQCLNVLIGFLLFSTVLSLQTGSAEEIVYDIVYADPALLFIGGPTCAAPPGCPLYQGSEVNPIGANSLTLYGNGGLYTLVNPVLLILGIPNNSSFTLPSITLSAGTGTVGGFKGTYDAGYSDKPNDVYHFLNSLGVIGPAAANGNGSESFTNWSAVDLAVLGITASNFGIYTYELNDTLFNTTNNPITATFGGELPVGTFAVSYGETQTTKCTGNKCTTTIKSYTTPFTQAGLQNNFPPPPHPPEVPEPTSLLLMGTGLLGMARLWMKSKTSR